MISHLLWCLTYSMDCCVWTPRAQLKWFDSPCHAGEASHPDRHRTGASAGGQGQGAWVSQAGPGHHQRNSQAQTGWGEDPHEQSVGKSVSTQTSELYVIVIAEFLHQFYFDNFSGVATKKIFFFFFVTKFVSLFIFYTKYILRLIKWEWLLCFYYIFDNKDKLHQFWLTQFSVWRRSKNENFSLLTEDSRNFLTQW